MCETGKSWAGRELEGLGGGFDLLVDLLVAEGGGGREVGGGQVARPPRVVLSLPENPEVTSFISRCEQWLCDDYSVDIRYIGTEAAGEPRLFDAAVLMNPLPPATDNGLVLSVPQLAAGQEQVASVSKEQLLALVRKAIAGAITVGGRELLMPSDGAFRFQPAVVDQNTWFMPLTLQVYGAPASALQDRNALDGALRAATPPFDGAEDLRAWLGLRLPDNSSLSTITILINPPVDIILDRSKLVDGILRLVLHAHPKADRSQVHLAVREVPGQGLSSRTQVADKIVWGEVQEGRVEGTVDVALTSATGALIMLLIGAQTVRRHWFIDHAKAPNVRYAGVQQFDSDLRMIRRALFEDTDSNRYEVAVGALLFLLGFSPSIQLETDSPDLIVATPIGRLVIVECTTRVADVASKIGKLVDRREALQRKLRTDNAGAEVSAVLVCRAPRDQIAAHIANLKAMRIVLASAEDITTGLTRAWATNNPDEILDQALRALST